LESSAWDRVGAGGLGLPEPPATLADEIRTLSTDHWGTREGTYALRGLKTFADEFERREHPGDYVLAGLEDAATNAPAIQYLLAYGNLGLFVEADVYEGRARVLLERVARLQGAYIAAAADGLVTDRLIVSHSAFGHQRWWTLGEHEDGGPDGVQGASAWLAVTTGRDV